ncbi:hypothetical protein GR158_12155 [Shinella sp. AETb1-6]|uniref:hypothetical protein n=1 Tax=Shinella sp. AETb1-6 TaxID=2692210 RepID=UPI00136C96D6|nr:hypothetical protein [Shinella sp. AETb1-6]MXN51875.1 hypothetical protein [Shinella sp. AETb1-6]
MLGFLADLPSWVTYALVGGVLGATFGAAGHLIGKATGLKWTRYAAIVGIVLTKPVVEQVMAPIIVNDKLNAGLPKMIDDITRMDRIEYQGKTFRYFYTITSTTGLEDVKEEELKKASISQMCDYWKPKLLSGETDAAEYNYALGARSASFSVVLSDCI